MNPRSLSLAVPTFSCVWVSCRTKSSRYRTVGKLSGSHANVFVHAHSPLSLSRMYPNLFVVVSESVLQFTFLSLCLPLFSIKRSFLPLYVCLAPDGCPDANRFISHSDSKHPCTALRSHPWCHRSNLTNDQSTTGIQTHQCKIYPLRSKLHTMCDLLLFK